MELKPCPFCQQTRGFYTNLHGRQYYDNRGNSAGYDFVRESKIKRCLSCGHKVNFNRLYGVNEDAEIH